MYKLWLDRDEGLLAISSFLTASFFFQVGKLYWLIITEKEGETKSNRTGGWGSSWVLPWDSRTPCWPRERSWANQAFDPLVGSVHRTSRSRRCCRQLEPIPCGDWKASRQRTAQEISIKIPRFNLARLQSFHTTFFCFEQSTIQAV